ncbi:MAG TPA: hypothetical protein VFL62_06245 [Bradyrhizobium sp.]|uniref:hypothetical protein n=1 Tax=Bradyrhizobium sp. TaxID=376 RepID=UPI002D7ED264|nr:hypothetical protein [Bradyrhizobium sp.]HET7885807.1 hypothetical protein [Bradyrhizobium sp.]
MHAPYEKSRQTDHRNEPKSSVGFLLLLGALAFVLIALVIVHPKSSVWISQAVQAEFGGGSEDVPVQTVQPDMAIPMRTVHAE